MFSHSCAYSIFRFLPLLSSLFFFNDTPTTEIYTLSLHDALPISESIDHDHLLDRGGRGDRLVRVVLEVDLRSEEHTSELQSHSDLVCRLLLEKKKNDRNNVVVPKNDTIDDSDQSSIVDHCQPSHT